MEPNSSRRNGLDHERETSYRLSTCASAISFPFLDLLLVAYSLPMHCPGAMSRATHISPRWGEGLVVIGFQSST
ncbi:MAG: hypothetical protein JJU46_08840 [Balneolaceae bacterium]|nr:hypothetical protein [Balneolaceae bacterium]MCH8549075.1 hypothetical protein [Balneolaceae bacterium]